MTETSQARRAEIALRARCATDGNWEWDESGLRAGNGDFIVWPANVPADPSTWAQRLGSCGRSAELVAESNATFIAHARDDIPWLLAELSRLTAQVEGIRAAVAPIIMAVEWSGLEKWESPMMLFEQDARAIALAARPGVEKEES